MVDDRLYRLTIPGTIYILFLAGWLVVDPEIQVLSILKSTTTNKSFLNVAMAAGALALVVGYLIGELAFSRSDPNPVVELCGTQQIVLRKRIAKYGALSPFELERLSVFTHLAVAKDNGKMAEYLQRAWSRIVIATYGKYAILLATVSYIVLVILVPSKETKSICPSLLIIDLLVFQYYSFSFQGQGQGQMSLTTSYRSWDWLLGFAIIAQSIVALISSPWVNSLNTVYAGTSRFSELITMNLFCIAVLQVLNKSVFNQSDHRMKIYQAISALPIDGPPCKHSCSGRGG